MLFALAVSGNTKLAALAHSNLTRLVADTLEAASFFQRIQARLRVKVVRPPSALTEELTKDTKPYRGRA